MLFCPLTDTSAAGSGAGARGRGWRARTRARTKAGFVGGCDAGERLHDVRRVLAPVHIFKSSSPPRSICNTFTQLDEEEEEEEQVVEIYPAVQWAAFLGNDGVRDNLESKTYFNQDFNASYMSEVLKHCAAALKIKQTKKSLKRLQLIQFYPKQESNTHCSLSVLSLCFRTDLKIS